MKALLLLFLFIFNVQPLINAQEIPNADFEKNVKKSGELHPEDWSNPTGNGKVHSPGYDSEYAVAVEGNRENDAAWHSQPVKVKPGALYEFSFWGKTLPGTQGGSATSGPLFVNRDFRLTEDWEPYAFVFRVPENEEETVFRVGQWHVNGTLVYDNIGLTPVQVIYKKQEGLTLGEGEKISGKTYYAEHQMNREGSNSCRFLQTSTARFNSNRWLLNHDSKVIYRHELPKRVFNKGEVFINLNHHTGGNCLVLIRSDNMDWTEVGRLDEVSSKNIELPKKAFPSQFIETKLVGEANAEEQCNFQINQYHFEGKCDQDLPTIQGRTEYARVTKKEENLSVEILDLGTPMPRLRTEMQLRVKNLTDEEHILMLHVEAKKQSDSPSSVHESVEAQSEAVIQIPYMINDSGKTILQISMVSNGNVVYECEIPITISYLYDAGYGSTLLRDDYSMIWWCPATHKVSQNRPLPSRENRYVNLSAARGEFEPVQIVLKPKKDLEQIEITVGEFTGADGTILSPEHFTVRQVEYVQIEHPSDEWGTTGWWPDPLPPVDQPLDLEAKRNWPFWITVQVPRDAAAGVYKGIVRFHNDSWVKNVPVRLQVYDFEIPKKFNLRTAFGFSVGNVKRYHNLETEDEVKDVIDLYYQNFRNHRISPYNPMEKYPIEAKIQDNHFVLDFDGFTKAARRYLDDFGFNTLRLPLVGMGGGTFHSRRVGRIGEHEAGSEEHERLFGEYASTIQDVLRENGWLEKSYVYWFDEPTPDDYEFVREGMKRIHRHAPDLQRMLTEQPEEELFGYVDIWCPVLHHYEEKAAHAHQEKGEEIWWYVCTGPKQPYPGLFTDHPAVDMRIWLWMTHKYDVEGCLVWQTNYWSSSAAYPDTLQDPWEDPMSYVSGYGRPAGYIGYWGNGDGRFLYPPKHWKSGEKIMSGPVDSIRWEMLREGIEDFEYFYAIRQALEHGDLDEQQKEIAKELLSIPESIVKSRTEYTKKAKPLYDYREKLARFLEDIQ